MKKVNVGKAKSKSSLKSVVPLKQKIVVDKLIKGVGKNRKNTMTQTMIDAGYSESYAKSGHIKKTKSWPVLLDIYLSDELLAKKHQELLFSKELDYFVFPKTMKDDEIEFRMDEAGIKLVVVRISDKGKMAFYSKANTRAIKDGIDLAYKAKGKMAPEKFEVEQTGLRSLSDQELADLIKKQKARFNKTD